eukprot:490233_1
MSNSELACTYATLALFDDDVEITAENIQKLLNAANVKVETYWPKLFQSLVEQKAVSKLITGACKGGGGSAAAATTGDDATAAEEKKEEAEEEESKSSSASGPGLFGGDSSSDEDSSSED